MHGIGEIRKINDQATVLGNLGPVKIPNLKARGIIQDTCATIVETCLASHWTAVERDTFALGYVRGRLDQLKQDENPATTAFAAMLLAQAAAGGYDFVARMVTDVTGNNYREH